MLYAPNAGNVEDGLRPNDSMAEQLWTIRCHSCVPPRWASRDLGYPLPKTSKRRGNYQTCHTFCLRQRGTETPRRGQRRGPRVLRWEYRRPRRESHRGRAPTVAERECRATGTQETVAKAQQGASTQGLRGQSWSSHRAPGMESGAVHTAIGSVLRRVLP